MVQEESQIPSSILLNLQPENAEKKKRGRPPKPKKSLDNTKKTIEKSIYSTKEQRVINELKLLKQ